MGVGCLPTHGPYLPGEPAFTLAMLDSPSNLFHVVDPSTGVVVCDGWPREREPQCPTRTVLTGVSAHVADVPPDQRCSDFRSWPAFVPRPGIWPLAARTDGQPPRWYVWWFLYDLQHQRCGACDFFPPHVIDHDHATGLVRGLLCRWCNTAEADARRLPDRCKHATRCYDSYRAAPPARHLSWHYVRRR